MKEVTKECTKVEKYTVYQAADGTEFTNSEECKKYEESALVVIRTKVTKLIVSENHDAWALLGGYDDNTVTVFKPQNSEDVDILMQLMLLENPWLTDDIRKELRDKRYSIISDACKNNDLVLFGVNCDNEYYFINSRQNIIDNLMNLDKKKEE